jgi:hypothetical protein
VFGEGWFGVHVVVGSYLKFYLRFRCANRSSFRPCDLSIRRGQQTAAWFQASYIAEIWTDCSVVVRSLKVVYATF